MLWKFDQAKNQSGVCLVLCIRGDQTYATYANISSGNKFLATKKREKKLLPSTLPHTKERTMADALVAASIQIVLEKLVSATTDVIGVAFGGFKELEKLKGSVAMIQAVMADAEKKQVQNQDVQLWLKRLEGVAFDADNLLDEINYEFLRRRMEAQNRLKQKVCLFFSTSCTFAFR